MQLVHPCYQSMTRNCKKKRREKIMESETSIIKLKGVTAGLIESYNTGSVTIYESKDDAMAASDKGKASPLFALVLEREGDETRFNVSGKASSSGIVKAIRNQVEIRAGKNVAAEVFGERDSDAPNKLTATERLFSSMLNGGGMFCEIGEARIAATFVGYVPVR